MREFAIAAIPADGIGPEVVDAMAKAFEEAEGLLSHRLLAALTAGVLAALQYLRVRPRRTRVVTSLFWRQAVEQAKARTLFERFRHPRTYLLLLAGVISGDGGLVVNGDTDDVILRLEESAPFDQIQLKRLKKRKLMLKDQIARIEDILLPDIIA